MASAVVAQPSLAQGLVVLTDSSFSEALNAVARDFETGRDGVRVQVQGGALGTLLERIGQGMKADVLAGADAQTLELGEQRRLLRRDARSVFATNAVALAVPASLKVPVQRLSDLARPEVARIAMASPSGVPAGRWAREAVDAQRLWSALQRKVVIVEDAREVLDLVARSDVEAGFIYASDVAAAAGRVRVVETLTPAMPLRHLAAVVASSQSPALASEFVAHLRSESAQPCSSGSASGRHDRVQHDDPVAPSVVSPAAPRMSA